VRYLDIAKLNEVEVKIVSCALVHPVGDEHFSADNLRHIRYLDIAELDEVQVKIVSCALVHSVGDKYFLVAKVVEGVDRITAQRVHFSAIRARVFSIVSFY
jgi:hypothetical protein